MVKAVYPKFRNENHMPSGMHGLRDAYEIHPDHPEGWSLGQCNSLIIRVYPEIRGSYFPFRVYSAIQGKPFTGEIPKPTPQPESATAKGK